MIDIPEKHIDTYMAKYAKANSIIQLDILQEECAELIKAITKYKRELLNPSMEIRYTLDNIVEEMTHVAISSEIVARILGFCPEEFQTEVNRKYQLAIKGGNND